MRTCASLTVVLLSRRNGNHPRGTVAAAASQLGSRVLGTEFSPDRQNVQLMETILLIVIAAHDLALMRVQGFPG